MYITGLLFHYISKLVFVAVIRLYRRTNCLAMVIIGIHLFKTFSVNIQAMPVIHNRFGTNFITIHYIFTLLILLLLVRKFPWQQYRGKAWSLILEE